MHNPVTATHDPIECDPARPPRGGGHDRGEGRFPPLFDPDGQAHDHDDRG